MSKFNPVFIDHYDGTEDVPETDTETILRKNARIRAKHSRSRLEIRQTIEARREAKELGIDVADLY